MIPSARSAHQTMHFCDRVIFLEVCEFFFWQSHFRKIGIFLIKITSLCSNIQSTKVWSFWWSAMNIPSVYIPTVETQISKVHKPQMARNSNLNIGSPFNKGLFSFNLAMWNYFCSFCRHSISFNYISRIFNSSFQMLFLCFSVSLHILLYTCKIYTHLPYYFDRSWYYYFFCKADALGSLNH